MVRTKRSRFVFECIGCQKVTTVSKRGHDQDVAEWNKVRMNHRTDAFTCPDCGANCARRRRPDHHPQTMF